MDTSVSVYHRAETQRQETTHSHSLRMANSEVRECFWPVEGNQSNQRTPTQAHGEHAYTDTQNCQ